MNQKINVFIVEDEFIIAKDISHTLEKLGYNVIGSSGNGTDALHLILQLKPDLVLLDIMLKGSISGIEVAEKIKDHSDIPFIFLTALADGETLNRAKVTEPFGYITKPFDEKSLYTSIETAIYKHQVNLKLKQRTRDLEEESVKSHKLLSKVLPADIISELHEKGIIEPREYEMVTLLFTDFQGFMNLSSQMPPEKLIDELNDIFKNFDTITEEFNLEKLKTIGDSYMAAGGLLIKCDDHALKVVMAAIQMQEYIKERNKKSQYKWIMRAGIHSGNVIAGVVGNHKFTYDVWGDTVNIASRMERYSQPGRINITSVTYGLIKDSFDCEYHGKAEVTNNFSIDMYHVVSLKNTPGNINPKSIYL